MQWTLSEPEALVVSAKVIIEPIIGVEMKGEELLQHKSQTTAEYTVFERVQSDN